MRNYLRVALENYLCLLKTNEFGDKIVLTKSKVKALSGVFFSIRAKLQKNNGWKRKDLKIIYAQIILKVDLSL